MGTCEKWCCIYIDFVCRLIVSAYFMILGFPLYFLSDGFHTLLLSMLVLTQNYQGGGGGLRGGGGRGGEAHCQTRVRGQPLPSGMLEYVAKLSSPLVVDSDFPAMAWGPCVQPYLDSLLPPHAKSDESKGACDLFRARTE